MYIQIIFLKLQREHQTNKKSYKKQLLAAINKKILNLQLFNSFKDSIQVFTYLYALYAIVLLLNV